MKHLRKFSTILLALALLAGQLLLAPAALAKADPVYTCLPTCEGNDARMLTVVGSNVSSLSDEDIELQIAVDSTATSFEVGFFDGDTGNIWDRGTTPLKYSLYADPLVQGDQSTLVGEWLGDTMLDNAWFNVTLPTAPEAQSPGGNYFYFLKIESSVLGVPGTMSNFKVRTDGLLLTFRPSPFAFQASLTNPNTMQIVYPQLPALTPTTYDGNFALYFYLSQSTTTFITWDGDLDHGAYNLSSLDTDDPDTPNSVPDWANPLYALPEGVAIGSSGSTGAPNDDSVNSYFQRSPSVIYSVTDPNSNNYQNENPSGNSEWEQFTISSDSSQPADHHVDALLPAGVYQVTLQGMDLGNLNAWRSLYPLLGVCQAVDGALAQPCKDILFPFLIGDTVFYDANDNGVQDPGEPGLPGVSLTLLDSNGSPVLNSAGEPFTTVTDSNGAYQFQVEGQKFLASGEVLNNGIYTVQVAPENFQLGGILYGALSTTGGDQQTNTDNPVIASNVLTYDFGYVGGGSIGDTVWQDSDGNGVFDLIAGELGLPGVTVTLAADFNNDGLADYTLSTVTDASGAYQFSGLPGGVYTITVDPSSLPAGMLQTYDLDGLLTPNAASLALAPGEASLLADYGYQPAVSPGTGTIGFWKTHPEAWPVANITIGGVPPYTRDQAIALMSAKSGGDKTYDLFNQLVAAKLNVGIGNQSSCISAQILAADAWLAQHPVGSKVKASSPAWKAIEAAFTALDAYNNGLLCAPHRD